MNDNAQETMKAVLAIMAWSWIVGFVMGGCAVALFLTDIA